MVNDLILFLIMVSKFSSSIEDPDFKIISLVLLGLAKSFIIYFPMKKFVSTKIFFNPSS